MGGDTLAFASLKRRSVDMDLQDSLKFLREREIVHSLRFGAL